MEPEIRAVTDITEETKAITEIGLILSRLKPEAAGRVLKWATDLFQVKPSAPMATNQEKVREAFSEIHELFEAAKPQSGLDNVLVAAYWFQMVEDQSDFDGFKLNHALKDQGLKSTNITRDLDSLINRSPQLVTLVRKEGTTKQARKRYKLTRVGIQVVEDMLSGGQRNNGTDSRT